MRRIFPLAIPLGFALACGGLVQSYGAGLQIICDAPNTCTECADVTPDMRMAMMAEHISTQLMNPEAITAFEAMAGADVKTRAKILRYEGQANGVTECPLAEMWEDEHRESWRTGIDAVCAFSVTCGSFDPADPGTLAGCLDDSLPWAVKDAVQGLDASDGPTLAASLQKLATEHGQMTCAAAAAFRNAK